MSGINLRPQLRQHYDEYYDGASEWRTLSAAGKVENIVRLCRDIPHRTVLEVGAGEGAVLQRLAELGFGEQLYALEISASALAAIESRRIPTLVEAHVFDGYRVPYADRQFDLVILSHVLEHVEHPRQLLYELARVADYVFIEVPLEDTLRLPLNYVPTSVGHINLYSARTVRHLAQTCGLEVVNQVVTNLSLDVHTYVWGQRGRLRYLVREAALRLAPGFAPRLWTYHSALLCRSPQKE